MKVKVNPNVIINEKKINDDLEKFAEVCATTIIEEAAQMIARFARKQMSGYYTEYYPRIYDRTDQMIDASYKPFTSSGRGVYEGGVIITFYIAFKDILSRGDKISSEFALKSITSHVIEEGYEAYSEYRPDENIDLIISPLSISARKTPSIFIAMFGNKLLIEAKRQLKDYWFNN